VTNSGNLACTVRATSSHAAAFPVTPASASVPAGGPATFTVSYAATPGVADSTTVSLDVDGQRNDTRFTGSGATVPANDFTISGLLRTGQAIQFTPQVNPSGSAVTSYQWDFGDGGTSSLALPTHTYSKGGVYTVTLAVGNACGTSAPTVHTTCIAEPAYIDITGFDASSSPMLTTNVPGWGTTVSLVLYRGPNVSYGALGLTICGTYISGEVIRCGRDANGNQLGGGESIGLPGQSFATAQLPVSSDACTARFDLMLAAPQWTQSAGPTVYAATGTCKHNMLGTICCDEIFCTNRNVTTHCVVGGGDGHVEWGLQPQVAAQWMMVAEAKITWNCWYVCPATNTPQPHPMQVVNSPGR
jgi:hypothetical protein